MNALSALLLEKETLTFADLQDCLGTRPFPPDAQLAAYINALPTKVNTVGQEEPGVERASGDLRRIPTAISGDRNVRDEKGSTSDKDAAADGHSMQQRKQSIKDTEGSNGDDKEPTDAGKNGGKGKKKRNGKGNAADDDDDDNDDDDDDRNGNNSKRGPRRKLFGGDDDSCLPELLRKNLKPDTPTPSAAAKKTDLVHTQ